MTRLWAQKCVGCITAVSLMAALVVGVFSQSHAASAAGAATQAADPCPSHMSVPVVDVTEDNCVTLCDSADLDQLTAILTDPTDGLDVEVNAVDCRYQVTAERLATVTLSVKEARGPPGNSLYLTTLRLRL